MNASFRVFLVCVVMGFAFDAGSVLAKPKLDDALGGGSTTTRPTKGTSGGGSSSGPATPSVGAAVDVGAINAPSAVAVDPPSPSDNGMSIRGASPPLGPAAAAPPVNDIGIEFLITSQLRNKVNEILASANANMAAQTSVRARINLASFKVFGVGPSATAFTDRPNHAFAKIPYMLTYKVDNVEKKTAAGWVATSVTRTISQSIDINVYCDGWETGKGKVTVHTGIGALQLEDSQGTAEQVVDFFLNGHLTELIDSLVRQQLNQIPIQNGTAALPFACRALSADNHGTADAVDDTIDFNQPGKTIKNAILNQFTVKLVSLERLAAKDLSGHALYQDVESPTINFFANFNATSFQAASMQVGEVRALTVPTLSTTRVGPALLLIANVVQNNNANTTDSAYRVFNKDLNYGAGTQAIIIKKSFWEPPHGQIRKPLEHLVDAYKLVVQIVGPPTDTVNTSGQLLMK
ncbi:MAG TPA: hypothetical protein VHM70_21285 [Polyangiaceae bacterium]|jgi:hypothetical protein|nr:hypothetical protein [Polyangiaceae bacterium]